MVPAGTTLEFLAVGVVSTWSPVESDASNVEAQVTNLLRPFMTVKLVEVTPTTWALGGLLEYDYTAHIVIATKEAHASAEDLTGFIVDALYRATGKTARVTLASDPYAPAKPDPNAGDPFAWLARLGEGVQSTVTITAIAAIAIAAVILYKR